MTLYTFHFHPHRVAKVLAYVFYNRTEVLVIPRSVCRSFFWCEKIQLNCNREANFADDCYSNECVGGSETVLP